MSQRSSVYEADVVIIGSGVAGALPAYQLSKKGVRVLIVDAGHRVSRTETVQRFRQTHDTHVSAPYPQFPGAQFPTSANNHVIETGPNLIRPLYLKAVGGTTWHWAATTPRFMPEEFSLKTRHNIGVDWPIGYTELEPYYLLAEQEMGVSGSADHDLGSWRSGPYPLAEHTPSWMENWLQTRLRHSDINLEVRPIARNTSAFDGRPPCTGNNSCTPICPTGAQYTANNHITKAEKYGAQVLDQCTAISIQLGKNSLVDTITCKRPDGSMLTVRGKRFILAANGIETPKLLLQSATDNRMEGVANSSGNVGRFLMNHHIIGANYTVPERVYSGRGHYGCMVINQFRETANKKNIPGMLFLSINKVILQGLFDRLMNKQQIYGEKLIKALRDEFTRQCSLSCFMEELPDSNNRVRPHPEHRDDLGIAKPWLHYEMSDYVKRGIKQARSHLETIGKTLRAESIEYHNDDYRGSAHLAGTTRMGANPKDSVVDSECRCHDHPNLYISSASVFPTIGTPNPTLTIAAIALRIADTVLKDMKT